MGMDSPRTGAPSIISYLATCSFSVYMLGAVCVCVCVCGCVCACVVCVCVCVCVCVVVVGGGGGGGGSTHVIQRSPS